jgi:hypothetical protein
MPRPPPLTRSAVEINIRPLSGMALRRIAEALGLAALPDYLATLIACMIASHRASRKPAKGHTPARVAAALRRIESRMWRGHYGPETMREITDPHFGMDVETWTRLAPIVADPDVPPGRKLALITTRRREIEAMPEIDARYARRVTLVGRALAQIWYWYAVDREDTMRQWQFVLAILAAAGEGTEGVRQHPERLKRDVGRLMQLTAQPAGSA